eukprot:IDg15402t1
MSGAFFLITFFALLLSTVACANVLRTTIHRGGRGGKGGGKGGRRTTWFGGSRAKRNSSEPACFPASALVTVNGKAVELHQLQLGAIVRTGSATTSPVFLFSHLDPDGTYEFVRISTNVGSLTASSRHVVWTSSGAREMHAVQAGDGLLHADRGVMVVTSVSRVL